MVSRQCLYPFRLSCSSLPLFARLLFVELGGPVSHWFREFGVAYLLLVVLFYVVLSLLLGPYRCVCYSLSGLIFFWFIVGLIACV